MAEAESKSSSPSRSSSTHPRSRALSKHKVIWSVALPALMLILTFTAWYFLRWHWLLLWLLVATVITGLAFLYDKWRAGRNAGEHGRGRVPEVALLTSSIVGGTIGSYAAMFGLRHKSSDRRFLIRLVIVTIVQAVIVGFLLARRFYVE